MQLRQFLLRPQRQGSYTTTYDADPNARAVTQPPMTQTTSAPSAIPSLFKIQYSYTSFGFWSISSPNTAHPIPFGRVNADALQHVTSEQTTHSLNGNIAISTTHRYLDGNGLPKRYRPSLRDHRQRRRVRLWRPHLGQRHLGLSQLGLRLGAAAHCWPISPISTITLAK